MIDEPTNEPADEKEIEPEPKIENEFPLPNEDSLVDPSIDTFDANDFGFIEHYGDEVSVSHDEQLPENDATSALNCAFVQTRQSFVAAPQLPRFVESDSRTRLLGSTDLRWLDLEFTTITSYPPILDSRGYLRFGKRYRSPERQRSAAPHCFVLQLHTEISVPFLTSHHLGTRLGGQQNRPTWALDSTSLRKLSKASWERT